MLAKRYKLPIQDFVGKRGRMAKSKYFSVKIFPSKEDFARFGVTISAKVAKKATERNLLKRLAYNSLKEYYSKISIADHWITILPEAAALPKDQFTAELRKLLLPAS